MILERFQGKEAGVSSVAFLGPRCPFLPLLALQMARRGRRHWQRWESWRHRERLGAGWGGQGDVPFGHELQTGPVPARL